MRRNMSEVERLGTVERYFVEVGLPLSRDGSEHRARKAVAKQRCMPLLSLLRRLRCRVA